MKEVNNKTMNTQERQNRIIARGEHSNHSHVVVGDAEIIRNDNGQILVKVGDEGAVLKHILESNWLAGQQVWTGEHHDIELKKGHEYKFVDQQEYDPFEDLVRRVID